MDSSDSDYDMLDALAWNCTQLVGQLSEIQSSEEENILLEQYLNRIDSEFDSIADFKDDLEWFNVSEPLSLKKSLQGKIVVLDFFTYCCINCMHILPDLKKLEQRFTVENGLVVVGVHSAKFDNEKDSENIRAAVQRYSITHPVVNDSQSSLWMDLNIKCWPTLLILGPRANPLFVLMGEGHSKTLEKYVSAALEFYRKTDSIRKCSLPIQLNDNGVSSTNLKFPGKIACSRGNENSDCAELYAISDSGNHRVLIVDPNGRVIDKIGGKEAGFADGDFQTTRFDSPQGVVFRDGNTVYVADTENHAIREIDLIGKCVKTIAGTGKQGFDQSGGKIGTQQVISSPWDVVFYRTQDMDMSFHMDNESVPERDVLLIAMAGTHQIWAIFKDETIWWKFKKIPAGTIVSIAGNGHEENRNNSYPQNAAFAQPSGIALSKKHREIYIADSESSCIRKMSLADGKVAAIVGGDRNPLNLFAFGDIDGVQMNAKLQHPLGVAYNAKEHNLYVADTYNHKVKVIDLSANRISTCNFKRSNGDAVAFNEPCGLCVSPDGQLLYVCNTNSHTIEVINLANNTAEHLNLKFNAGQAQTNSKHKPISISEKVLIHSEEAAVHLEFKLSFDRTVKLTEDAPQKWKLLNASEQWTVKASNGVIEKDQAIIDIKTVKVHTQGSNELLVEFKLNLCSKEKDVCFPKLFVIRIPIEYSAKGSKNIDRKFKISLDEKNVTVA